ncbi:MAG: hypothetical protein JNL97_02500 [Verrucomicrobiales bacterium]|nr:hypothetical protein [Verrucomicrobiales bacterium]
MNLRTLWIVVGATAAVLAVGLVGVVAVGKLAQKVRVAVTSEAARQQFVARWKPPKTPTPESLAPERVGAWKASRREESARWDDVGLDRSVVRVVYVPAAGKGPEVEVVACRMAAATEAADRERAGEALGKRGEGRGGMRRVVRLNDRWQWSSGEPPEEIQLWALPGWLIGFRSEAEIPLPLMRGYLEAIAEPEER